MASLYFDCSRTLWSSCLHDRGAHNSDGIVSKAAVKHGAERAQGIPSGGDRLRFHGETSETRAGGLGCSQGGTVPTAVLEFVEEILLKK